MGRGDDQSVGAAPPKRNPFRQEIVEGGDGLSVDERLEAQARELETRSAQELSKRIEKTLEEYFSEKIDPQMTYNDVKEDRIIKMMGNISPGGGESAIDLELQIQRHNNKILEEISEMLANEAGSDLQLAEKLESLLAGQGDRLFYLEESRLSDEGYAQAPKSWIHSLDRSALSRFLRNLKRTMILHQERARSGQTVENPWPEQDLGS